MNQQIDVERSLISTFVCVVSGTTLVALALPFVFLTGNNDARNLTAHEMATLRGGQVAGYCCWTLAECDQNDDCAGGEGTCTSRKEYIPQAGSDYGCIEGQPTQYCAQNPSQPSACNAIYKCKDGEMGSCERGDFYDYVYAAIDCGPDYCNE